MFSCNQKTSTARLPKSIFWSNLLLLEFSHKSGNSSPLPLPTAFLPIFPPKSPPSSKTPPPSSCPHCSQTNKQPRDSFTINAPFAELAYFIPKMASSTVQNPPAPVESKSARKKKAKVERTESPAPAASTSEKAASVAGGENQDDLSESHFIREIQKSVYTICLGPMLRNLLTAAQEYS